MGQFQTDFLMLVREDVTNTVFFFFFCVCSQLQEKGDLKESGATTA